MFNDLFTDSSLSGSLKSLTLMTSFWFVIPTLTVVVIVIETQNHKVLANIQLRTVSMFVLT